MKDTRIAEIAWLTVIAVLVATGGTVVLAALDRNRAFGSVLLAAGVAVAAVNVRRSMRDRAASARRDVTKAGAYLVAAILAFVAIAFHVHWAIGGTIAAAEAALVFDIVVIAARPKAARGEETF